MFDLAPESVGEPTKINETTRIQAIVEAILLVLDYPISISALASLTCYSEAEISSALMNWQTELDNKLSGLQVRELEEGWRLTTRSDYAEYIERALGKNARLKLTRSALETLAIVAYKQPVMRAEVSEIRGVNSDAMLRSLVLKGLIEVDASSGVAYKYITTKEFLAKLGLTSLTELPPLGPLLPEIEMLDQIVDEFQARDFDNF